MIEMIPKACLSLLPFRPEPLSCWSEESDVLTYLKTLFGKSESFTDDQDPFLSSVFPNHGIWFYEQGRVDFAQMAKRFFVHAITAKPTPAADKMEEDVPDFYEDKNFGLMAKYHIAWSSTINEILSEDAHFSITLTLESESELNCSIGMASRLYYKHALQVLRNFLECVLVEVFFCDSPSAHASWKANMYRVPPFKGTDGVLNHLQRRGILSAERQNTAERLCDDLDIHLCEKELIHAGIFSNDYSGLIFQYRKFAKWTDCFARCVDFALPLLKSTVDAWQKKRSNA